MAEPSRPAKRSRQELVECPCTKCGPGSEKITQAALKLHTDRDRELKLKETLPPANSVSAASYMSRRRNNRGATNSSSSNSAPRPVENTNMDIDSDTQNHFIQPGDAASSPNPNSLPLNDADMPDAFPQPTTTTTINQPAFPNPPVAVPSAPSTPSAPPLAPRSSLAEESPYWFWQIILFMTAWLHLHFHSPHRACDLILKVLSKIFITLGLIKPEDKVPVTLATTFKRLGLNEEFDIRAVCPQCRRTFPGDSPADLLCSQCQVPLFNTPPPATTTPLSLLTSSRPKMAPKPVPVLQAPHLLLSTQIIEFLNRDGNEIACESYLTRKCIPGKMQDIQDGEICQSLKGPDGRKFFDTAPDRPNPDELRIGLCFGEDGFSFTRTKDSASHTTGAASFCVTGLPNHLRYRPRNLLLSKLSPGPHDETADEFQRSMAEMVTNLLMLYDDGIFVKTPKYPNGRRAGGFSDHNAKKFPCTCCTIAHKDIKTPKGMKVDAFPARDGNQHKAESAEYAKIPETDKKARDTFAAAHGTRFFEFSRLTYFDPVRQIIIDPMHCIFLGVVKTQWLDAWIRDPPALRKSTEVTSREIDQFQDYLHALEMPSWVARLPNKVGLPAGGNLTSDEWKGMLFIFCPLILPHLWAEWFPIAAADHNKAKERWKTKEKARLNRIADGTDSATDRKGPAAQPKPIRMLENDPDLLLKLAACCKILLGGTIDLQSLPRAQQLLEDYLAGFLKNHPDLVKPNHHYLTHIFRIIRDFGPVYGFWTFLFERLNKLLKSYDTNNHGNGELEVTFFREFHRDANLRDVLQKLARKAAFEDLTEEEQCVVECARTILATDGDVRGTVASLTCEIETLSADLGTAFSMGRAVRKDIPPFLQRELLEYYQLTYPNIQILARDAPAPRGVEPNFLYGSAQVHEFFILDGRRITSSESMTDASSAIIQLHSGGVRHVGQIFNILTHHQPGLEKPELLLDVRWMRRCLDVDMTPWEPYPELEVFSWEHGQFLRRSEPGPGRIVSISSILSQACRLTIHEKTQIAVDDPEDSDIDEEETTDGPVRKLWFTAGLSRDVAVV
ncbi:hypothetical protein B0H16DRAFT_1729525 [Mycena metata]|uniref:Transposase domain-containing protein n=1 Tax=Mycena metata TaxID=1033252 RepID=A0AAD7IBJ3_9AGAR|nr:hypothetical protein B0H16DRAFT_1729525 [Mycena metata]